MRIGLQPGGAHVGGHLPVELLELVGTAGGYFDGLLLKRALLVAALRKWVLRPLFAKFGEAPTMPLPSSHEEVATPLETCFLSAEEASFLQSAMGASHFLRDSHV